MIRRAFSRMGQSRHVHPLTLASKNPSKTSNFYHFCCKTCFAWRRNLDLEAEYATKSIKNHAFWEVFGSCSLEEQHTGLPHSRKAYKYYAEALENTVAPSRLLGLDLTGNKHRKIASLRTQPSRRLVRCYTWTLVRTQKAFAIDSRHFRGV